MRTNLILDFDSTIVGIEILDELANIVLRADPERTKKVDGIKKIAQAGMEGRIGFAESLSRRISLVRADPEHLAELSHIVQESVSKSFLENQAFLSEHSDEFYLVSGGFKEFILPVAERLGIRANHVYANTLIKDDHGTVIGCDTSNVMAQDDGKVVQLRRLGLDGAVIMVGDGYTDYRTREAGVADQFIAYCEHVKRSNVIALADHVAYTFNDVMSLCYTVAGSAVRR